MQIRDGIRLETRMGMNWNNNRNWNTYKSRGDNIRNRNTPKDNDNTRNVSAHQYFNQIPFQSNSILPILAWYDSSPFSSPFEFPYQAHYHSNSIPQPISIPMTSPLPFQFHSPTSFNSHNKPITIPISSASPFSFPFRAHSNSSPF